MFVAFLIWLLGALLAAAIFINSAHKAGSVRLDDLLIGILTCLFSFCGIVFLALLNVIETVAEHYRNPCIWTRKKEEKQK